jgi:hypothetical protein
MTKTSDLFEREKKQLLTELRFLRRWHAAPDQRRGNVL